MFLFIWYRVIVPGMKSQLFSINLLFSQHCDPLILEDKSMQASLINDIIYSFNRVVR
jgi:hypothetical protein